MRWLLHLGEGNKANVIRLANPFEGPANPHVSREALSLIRRVFKGSDGGRHGKSPAQPWIAWILVRPLLLALLAKGYQLVGAKAPAFDEPHLLMMLHGLVAPVPGAGGLAGAFALRFVLPDADHEWPGRLVVCPFDAPRSAPKGLPNGRRKCPCL